jgi:hypothetical protein
MDTKKYSLVLWDVPEGTTDLDESFVVKRVLSFGGIFLIKDLIKSLGIERVKAIFDSMKPTEISPKKYNFFKNFLLV